MAHAANGAFDWLTTISDDVTASDQIRTQGRDLLVSRCVRSVEGKREENVCKVEALVRSKGAERKYYQVRVQFTRANSTTTIGDRVCSCAKCVFFSSPVKLTLLIHFHFFQSEIVCSYVGCNCRIPGA